MLSAITLNDKLTYTLIYVCRTCGYMQDIVSNVLQPYVVDDIDKHVQFDCPMCSGGEFNYRYCACHTKYLNLPFNALTFRVMTDGHYLREAYENPCSLNICTCDQRKEYSRDFTLVSYNRQYPFVCGQCTKFFLHEDINRRQDISFGFLRSIQLNIFFHILQGKQHIDLTDMDNVMVQGLHFKHKQ